MGLTNVRCFRADCFNNICGVSCRLLEKPIEDHLCPFHKTEEQITEDRMVAVRKLEERGRYDLIKNYIYNPKRNW